MIAILTGLGVAAATSVWIATLRGIGQSSARLGEICSGGGFGRWRSSPCLCDPAAGLRRGAVQRHAQWRGVRVRVRLRRGQRHRHHHPRHAALVLFDHRVYGSLVGRLLAPGFVVSATAPLVYATVIDRFGEAGGLYLLACGGDRRLRRVGVAAACISAGRQALTRIVVLFISGRDGRALVNANPRLPCQLSIVRLMTRIASPQETFMCQPKPSRRFAFDWMMTAFMLAHPVHAVAGTVQTGAAVRAPAQSCPALSAAVPATTPTPRPDVWIAQQAAVRQALAARAYQTITFGDSIMQG